jgi:hypothetical protein
MKLQSIRFDKKQYSFKEAKEHAKKLGLKVGVKPNPQYKNYHAFRQLQPREFIKGSFRTEKKRGGILLIIGKLKNKK